MLEDWGRRPKEVIRFWRILLPPKDRASTDTPLCSLGGSTILVGGLRALDASGPFIIGTVVVVIQTSEGDTNSGKSGERNSPVGSRAFSPVGGLGDKVSGFVNGGGFHGAEREPITGVWW